MKIQFLLSEIYRFISHVNYNKSALVQRKLVLSWLARWRGYHTLEK